MKIIKGYINLNVDDLLEAKEEKMHLLKVGDKIGRILLVYVFEIESEWLRSLLKELVELLIYELNLSDSDKKGTSV